MIAHHRRTVLDHHDANYNKAAAKLLVQIAVALRLEVRDLWVKNAQLGICTGGARGLRDARFWLVGSGAVVLH
jgi:hypothetical protein